MLGSNMIRSATTEDQGAIQELVFSVLRSYGLEPSPQSIDADLYILSYFISRREGIFQFSLGLTK